MSDETIPSGPIPAATRPPGVEAVLDPFTEDVRALIRKHRQHAYISHSNLADTPTGNRYQTLALGDEHEAGFRTHRDELFSRICFHGATVLDVGCNTGELSRLAREHGATLVDGFDYDPFWIALAQLVNVHNSVTRVSFYAADATSPEAYRGQYDIVLAFSVFPYISKALPALVAATRKLLVLETHLLNRPGALKQYFDALEPHFPAHHELESTDWGAEREGERKVIAFARDEVTLAAMLRESQPSTAEDLPREGTLDVERSELRFLEKFSTHYRNEISKGFDSLMISLRETDPGVFSDALEVASGIAYWVAFLRGYAAFRECGTVDASNLYVTYLRDLFHKRPFDLGLVSTINDTNRLVERIQKRYITLDRMREDTSADVEPVVLYNISATRDGFRLYDTSSNRWLSCESFDGYHRLFSARVTGRSQIPFVCRDIELRV